jgi:phenylacetate-CoA ligase
MLKKLQNKRLRAIVKQAYENVQFYHDLFKEAKLTPDAIKTTEDLIKIPILSKDVLRSLPFGKITASNINLNRCTKAYTSGSTGTPLTVYCNKEATLENHLRSYRWQLKCGNKITNRQAVINASWVPIHPIQKLGIYKTIVIPSADAVETQIAKLEKFKPDTLHTLPSCVRILAKETLEKGSTGLKMKRVFTGGEMLDEYTREICWEAFGAEIFDGYGTNELYFLSGECPEGTGQHFEADSRILEIIKDDQSVSCGKVGDVVVTDLTNYATPLIRYNLEDLGELMEDKCPCGSSFPLFRITQGRKSDVIRLTDGSTIPALVIYQDLSSIEGIKQFQLIQEKPDFFTLKIVKGKDFSDLTIEKAKSALLQRLGKIEINAGTVDAIQREKSGKFKPFKTNLLL